jgi:hypothetical protein
VNVTFRWVDENEIEKVLTVTKDEAFQMAFELWCEQFAPHEAEALEFGSWWVDE